MLYSRLMTLDELKINEKAIIKSLNQKDLKLKMMEMGLLEAQQIQVLFKAPFNGPVAIKIIDYTLSLRLDEAKQIEVEKI